MRSRTSNLVIREATPSRSGSGQRTSRAVYLTLAIWAMSAALVSAQTCLPTPTGPLKFKGAEGQWLVPDHRQASDNLNGRVVPSWYVPDGMILEVETVSVNSNVTPFSSPAHLGIVRVSPHPSLPGAMWFFGIYTAEVYAEPLLGWTPTRLVLHVGERLAVRANVAPQSSSYLQLILHGYWWPASCLREALR